VEKLMQVGFGKLWLHTVSPYLVILFVAGILTLPAGLSPIRLHDSFWIDWVWADQFTDQLRQGYLYPRWLPKSHNGLGSPVFYYYPPVAFYITSIFSFLGFSTYWSIISAFGAGFALSGTSMFLWLNGWAKRPLLGALMFMGAPYHLLDLYARGALAEFVGIAIIPLVALGLRRISDGKGIGVLAAAYAGLIATHLPLALLTSLLLVVPYALILGRKRRQSLITIVAALAFGIALASIYLLPALSLDEFRDSERLWASPEYKPAYWTFLNGDWSNKMKVIVAILAATIALPSFALTIIFRSGWALYCAIICLVVAGGVPFLWSTPIIEAVQFPFRALPLAEFGLATAFACLQGRMLLPAFVAAPSLLLSILFLTVPPPDGPGFTFEWVKSHYPDVPEYLPRGERPYSMPSIWAIELGSDLRAATRQNGVTVEPVFYFPSWRVKCEGRSVQTFPAQDTRLLAFRGDACSRSLGFTSAEIVGALISLVALGALMMMHLVGRWLRRRRQKWGR